MSLPGAEETDQPKWHRASYCQNGECLEAARQGTNGMVLVHSSKRPGDGSLALTATQWRSLLSGVKSGQYSHLSR